MHLSDWPKPAWTAANKILDEVTGLQEAFASAALDGIQHAKPPTAAGKNQTSDTDEED